MSKRTRPLLFDVLNICALDEAQQTMIDDIDAMLPQTQCGLCGYRDGCLPYAHAIVVNGEKTNLCVPGGDALSAAISHYLNRPVYRAAPSKWQIHPITLRPTKMLAVIDESACIGCTKCIPACPVDAIIGTAKHMHSIVPDLCTGCELCLAPCPVDCIHIITHPDQTQDSDTYREQYYHHLHRMAAEIQHKPIVSHTQAVLGSLSADTQPAINKDTASHAVKLAKLRTQIKKLEKQLAVGFDEQKSKTLEHIKQQLADAESSF